MRYWLLVWMMCAVSGASASAHAQRTISVAVAGGVSLPVGNFSESVGTGWHVAGGLLLSSSMQPIALRADATRHQFAFDDPAPGNQAITSGTLSMLYRLPSAGRPLAPYLSAGAGAYRVTCGGDATCEGATRFGWNIGAGSRLVILGLHAFIEARYHTIVQSGTNARFIPFSAGFTL